MYLVTVKIRSDRSDIQVSQLTKWSAHPAKCEPKPVYLFSNISQMSGECINVHTVYPSLFKHVTCVGLFGGVLRYGEVGDGPSCRS